MNVNKRGDLGRRRFIRAIAPAGLGMGLGLNSPAVLSKEAAGYARTTYPDIPTYPLVQDYNIIHAVDDPGKISTGSVFVIRLPSGRLLTGVYQGFWRHNRNTHWARGGPGNILLASDDDGKTWQKTGEGTGPMISVGDRLYQFRVSRTDNLNISVSDDEGATWSIESTVLKGKYYNNKLLPLIRGNTLYWCLGMPNSKGQWNSYGSRTVAIAADLNQDLRDPAAWRMSEPLTYPGTPPSLTRDLHGSHDHYLEGTVIDVGGQLKVYWRIRIDNQGTAGIAAICDLDDDGTKLSYKFGQFHPLPGAQNDFSILSDKETGLYWLISNLVTRTQDQEWNRLIEKNHWFKTTLGGHERRILVLHVSFDALNWLPAAYLVIMPQLHQAANYVKSLIDGKDLIFTSRTCINGPNSHDADMVTFHRLPEFRDLARPLLPLLPAEYG